jgi:hypothetical protein
VTLAPETRALLTDALRPPPGHRVDVAVATTYSLDLIALLLAPLNFAMHEHRDDVDAVDPITLLETVRRYAEHTTVFCQAGAIHVPAAYRSVLTFTEDSVVEVAAPREGRLFHPKVWTVRFCDADGKHQHRCLVLSRNLTFDQSWDTVLRLDQANDDGRPSLSSAPVADLLAALPGLALRPLHSMRRERIEGLADSVRRVRLALPEGFDQGELLTLGLAGSTSMEPGSFDRLLAMSAFLDAATMKDLGQATTDLLVLSRAESLDLVASSLGEAQTYVLQRSADSTDQGGISGGPTSTVEPEDASPAQGPSRGLHAKTFIGELGSRAVVITGSANATRAGFDGNVEVVARLEGPARMCGIDSVWDGTKDAPGMSRLVEPYTPRAVAPDVEERAANDWAIQRFHAALAAADPSLSVTEHDTDRYEMQLTIGEVLPPPDSSSRVRLLSLPEHVESRDLAPSVSWGPLGLLSITPYVVVTTTIGRGAQRVRSASIVKAQLIGDVPQRRQRVLRAVLRTKSDVLRYLVFLLGDPALESMFAASTGNWEGRAGLPGGTYDDVALFEPLVRAVVRGDESLDRVASLLMELQETEGGEDLIPDGFTVLWDAVWEVHREEARG